MAVDNNQKAFLALLRAGLWEKELQLAGLGKMDFHKIYDFAVEQSVVGLIAAGFEHVTDIKVPKENVLLFVGNSMQLEHRNMAMNAYLEVLVQQLRERDIYALLVKGQGLGQCYSRPLWRASGDIDLLLSKDNYIKAESLLVPLAVNVENEISFKQHLAMTIDSWEVELHGTLRGGLWRRFDHTIDEVQRDVFCGGRVRSWMNNNTQIFLPGADEDVVFVFAHILQHFYKEGIGLRQICDWCRLLWTYKDDIDINLLESRIRKAGIMTEWKAFGALSVIFLGIPATAMPFFSDSRKWKRSSRQILSFILETGNFGHNRDYSYRLKYPFIIYKLISLWRHSKDHIRYFFVFPLDSIKIWFWMVITGLKVAMAGSQHE